MEQTPINIYWFYRPPQDGEIGPQCEVVLATQLDTKQYAAQREWRYIDKISLTRDYWNKLYSETRSLAAASMKDGLKYDISEGFWTVAEYAKTQGWWQ